MKLKPILLATCLTAGTLFIQSPLTAQPAPPAAPNPGAPPKCGPENRPPGGRNPEERIAHLKEALGLTPEQETKIRDIFKTEGEKMRAQHEANKGNKPAPEELRAKRQEVRKRMEASIKAVLTPEQQTKLEAMRKERKDRGPNPPVGTEIPKP